MENTSVMENINNEAEEIVRIFDQTGLFFWPVNLIKQTHDKLRSKYNDNCFPILGVYLLGYIHGIRAERKRRKRKSV